MESVTPIRNLVVGANSILARQLIDLLLSKGQQVSGVFHQHRNNLVEGIDHYRSDQLDGIKTIFDKVFIISAFIPDRTHVKGAALSQSLFDVNVSLINSVCEKFPLARIIYTSSVSVYGANACVKDEHSDCNPATEYGVSKLWGEKIVGSHDHYAIVRISSMYGIGMKETTFIPFAINSALKKNAIDLLGDGSRAQNYIQVRDVAKCLYLASETKENEIFLATAMGSVTNLQLASTIQEITGCSINFKGEDATPSSYYNNERTRFLTGFLPDIGLISGIKELIEWKRKMS
ncbi:MAG: NAD(P)-dependent oxidoreductase [Chitinophagaceae bacterium]|nr:NAD(P)-dependent oxidoreductase [Chitinophagaceae bacterium]